MFIGRHRRRAAVFLLLAVLTESMLDIVVCVPKLLPQFLGKVCLQALSRLGVCLLLICLRRVLVNLLL